MDAMVPRIISTAQIFVLPLQNCLSPFGDIVHIRFEEVAVNHSEQKAGVGIFDGVVINVSAVNKLCSYSTIGNRTIVA